MIKLISALRSAAKRVPLILAMTRAAAFPGEMAAHYKLIRPYRSQHGQLNLNHVVQTPLLIGYFETGFGLGEYARGLACALDFVGAEFSVYPYNAYTGRPRDEAVWTHRYDVENVHSINIFCMAANQTRYARRIIGKRHTENSYNILSTFWELPRAPESWRSDLEYFNELWTPNHFVAESFRPIFAREILTMPPCINLAADTSSNRAKFGFDASRFYFLFYFDFNSSAERKNPLAVVRAFEEAFGDGQDDDVGLVLKTNGDLSRALRIVSELDAAVSRDRRIRILHGDWPRAEVLSLLASTDCFVSLHRSEGFGMGMAEAMLLGKPVVGTAFSGNTDFLTPETGYPVPYQMRAVRPGEYPHSAGNSWADPDVSVAAAMMRGVASKTEDVCKRALRGQAYVQQHYSPNAVGGAVAARLREIRTNT